MITLAALEEIIGASGIAPRIEAVLPIGVRSRQLRVRTLLAGMCLTQADGRPAHLTRVHQALTSLPGEEQRRPGVITEWKHGPHLLTYRQAEYTSGLIAGALGKQEPDGLPSAELQAACDDLLEASIPDEHKNASTALAVDWTDMETFSRPPPKGTSDCADPEASWGHRKNNLLRCEDELFFGYYLSAGTMMPDEHGPPVPEYARRITLSSCRQDPVPAFVPVLTTLPAAGIALGDILADSGYAYRIPANWAVPLRTAGAQLIQDLHPSDRGPHGTHHGAIISNGNLYCPARAASLLELGPLARGATREQAAPHDTRTAELARYKLGRITATTPTATTASCAPRSWARSAARSALSRWPWTGTGPRSSPRRRTRPPAAPSRPSPSRPGHRQDRAETRLPLRRAPPLLRPPHRRRTRLRHPQRPSQQRHLPRLVPHHGPGPHAAVHHLPDHHPQPAHHRRMGQTPGSQRPPRRRRPAARTRRRRRKPLASLAAAPP